MTAPFITYRELHEGKLNYYILQKAFPHYLMRVSTNSYEEVLMKSEIPGYSMMVVCEGTLRGGFIPNYRDVGDEIQAVMQNAAAWFWADRIQRNPTKYKKFKIQSNVAGNHQ